MLLLQQCFAKLPNHGNDIDKQSNQISEKNEAGSGSGSGSGLTKEREREGDKREHEHKSEHDQESGSYNIWEGRGEIEHHNHVSTVLDQPHRRRM